MQIDGAIRLLIESKTAVTLGQLCAAAGADPHYGGLRVKMRSALKKHFRDRLIILSGRYKLAESKQTVAIGRVAFKLPKGLWRGWVDPRTGITPPKLGLDNE